MPLAKRKTPGHKLPRRITASMFFRYDACPHWLWFDVYGDQRKKKKASRFAEMLLQMGLVHEEKLIAGLACVEVGGATRAERRRKTLELMRKGTDCIYHGVLTTDEFDGEPDILEKRTDRSSDLGAYYYVPVDIKSAERLNDAHKYQLVLYGELLKGVQGVRPEEGYIINGSGARIGFPLREFELQFHKALGEIREILAGKLLPPHVSSSCRQSPWFDECIALAERTNDIALLYNVRKKAVIALREAGIRTIGDVLAMDIDAIAGSSPALTRKLLDRIALQARALVEKRHFVRSPIVLPSAAHDIFFDIEGDPLRQVEYLFGFLVRHAVSESYVHFLAERPEAEGEMWARFLEWLETLPADYAVYHYGTYETVRLGSLERKYGGSAALDRFRDRMVDLNEVVKECVVFPLYFYGIKYIGGYIGYERQGSIAGGGESVAVYEEWLETGKRKKLDEIVEYNKDDVIATRFLKDWLEHERSRPHHGSELA